MSDVLTINNIISFFDLQITMTSFLSTSTSLIDKILLFLDKCFLISFGGNLKGLVIGHIFLGIPFLLILWRYFEDQIKEKIEIAPDKGRSVISIVERSRDYFFSFLLSCSISVLMGGRIFSSIPIEMADFFVSLTVAFYISILVLIFGLILYDPMLTDVGYSSYKINSMVFFTIIGALRVFLSWIWGLLKKSGNQFINTFGRLRSFRKRK